MPRNVPQAAQVEDYDSEESSVKPGTRVQATRGRAASARPQRRDAASDSGYSSHNSTANADLQSQGAHTSASRQTSGRASASKPKPIIHRADNQQRALSRSASLSRHCNDPNCREATCMSKRNLERKYPSLQPGDTPEQYPGWYYYAQQQRQQQAQPTQPSYTQPSARPTVPMEITRSTAIPSVPTPRPSRPLSFHGYSATGTSSAAQHGPPPSPSAYRNCLANYYRHYQAAYQPPPNTYVPTSGMTAYGATTSPTSPNHPPAQTYTTYSARQINPAVAGHKYEPSTSQPRLTRTLSARQPSTRPMPGAFPDDELSASEYDSQSDYSQDDEDRYRKSKRDSKLMPPPRRPSLSTARAATAPALRRARERSRHAPRSDMDIYEQSSSDNVDSDRTARAVVNRPRTDSSYSSRSRRPSVSTSASGRTKATSMSSGSGSGYKVIVEDRRGRTYTYMSKEEQDDLIRRLQQQKLDEQETLASSAAYQQRVSGSQGPELTAENIRKYQRRVSGSHLSGGRSQKSAGSSKGSRADAVRVEAGGTVLHVYPGATIEMQPGEDGSPVKLIIGSSSRDSGYYGSSKGSGSRLGRRKQDDLEGLCAPEV